MYLYTYFLLLMKIGKIYIHQYTAQDVFHTSLTDDHIGYRNANWQPRNILLQQSHIFGNNMQWFPSFFDDYTVIKSHNMHMFIT